MAHPTPSCQTFISMSRHFSRLKVSDPLTRCLAPRLLRQYATHADLPTADSKSQTTTNVPEKPAAAKQAARPKDSEPVFTTLYSWPSMEPSSFSNYPSHQLNVPLRRDILHRAVIYEGDMTRQGSGSTKHRTAVRGSSRKIRPQKGTGSARLSDRKSPSIRGGGVAHGPHPRDFATGLPSKIYDLAWRTALSYRYRKGELIILKNSIELSQDRTARWLNNLFITNGWGKGNGRSLLVRKPSEEEILKEAESHLLKSMEQVGEHVKVKDMFDVDVKDLLSCGRVIIEEGALKHILRQRNP